MVCLNSIEVFEIHCVASVNQVAPLWYHDGSARIRAVIGTCRAPLNVRLYSHSSETQEYSEKGLKGLRMLYVGTSGRPHSWLVRSKVGRL